PEYEEAPPAQTTLSESGSQAEFRSAPDTPPPYEEAPPAHTTLSEADRERGFDYASRAAGEAVGDAGPAVRDAGKSGGIKMTKSTATNVAKGAGVIISNASGAYECGTGLNQSSLKGCAQWLWDSIKDGGLERIFGKAGGTFVGITFDSSEAGAPVLPRD